MTDRLHKVLRLAIEDVKQCIKKGLILDMSWMPSDSASMVSGCDEPR